MVKESGRDLAINMKSLEVVVFSASKLQANKAHSKPLLPEIVLKESFE